MLKNISKCLALSMLMIICVPVIVGAQTDTVEPKQAVTTSADSSSDQLTAEEKAQKLKMRIAAAKDKVSSKVTATQEKRIAGLCKASQTVIENIKSNTSKFLENRQTRQTAISDKLNSLSEKLAVAGADTTDLDAAIKEMENLSLTNSTAINDYAASLTDMTTMDCASDPSGFKAILETARLQRQEALSQTTSLRTYINETIKPILQDIRNSLQSTTEGEGTN